MSRKLYWWLGGAAGVLLLIVVVAAIALSNLNWARGRIEAAVKGMTGRELKIEGDLRLRLLSLHPRIRAGQVTFQNVEWGEDVPMFAADAVDVSFSVPSLLGGRLVIHEAALGDAQLLLERDSEGRNNWTFDTRKDGKQEAGGGPPVVRSFAASGLAVTVKDAVTGTQLQVNARTGEDNSVRFEVEGTLNEVDIAISGTGGAPHTLLDQSTPYPLKLEGKLAGGDVSFDGTITGLPNPHALDAAITASGRNVADLAKVARLAAPDTAPFKLKGQLSLDKKSWSVAKLGGTVGRSDISGEVSLDLSNGRPVLEGSFKSRQLDIGDLAGFVGGKPGEAAQKKKVKAERLLPAAEIRPQTLRALDAKVTFAAGSFRNRDMLPLDNLTATMALNDGVMKVDPLRFGVAGGRLDSKVGIDAREDTMNVSIDSSVRGLRLGRLAPGTESLDTSIGGVDGRIELKGRGNSAAAVLGSSNGHIDLVSGGGEMSNLVMEAIGLDAAEVVKFFVGGDKNVQLRCGVVAFAVQDGVMESKVIVLDTDDTYIGGEGVVSLRDERMNLKFTPLPKDVSILTLRGPLLVRGTFSDPDIGIEKTGLARKAGAAIMLGLVNPLLALLPTVETAPGKDEHAPCADLVAELEEKVKPGKPKVVPEKRKKELEQGQKDNRK